MTEHDRFWKGLMIGLFFSLIIWAILIAWLL